MSIHDRDATGQPAYFPGFSSTSTSAEPFFVEIEENPAPPAADAEQRPAWLPSPKRQVQSEAPKKPVPPVPNRSRPPESPPVRGGKRALIVNSKEQEPEEELPWQEQVVRWIQGEGGAGFGVSVLVHVVLLLMLSLLVLAAPVQDENLITTVDQTELVDVASIQDVEIVAPPKDFEPQIKDPQFDPALNPGSDSKNLNLSSLGVGLNSSAGSLIGTKGGGLDFKIPAQAVTKGSFTVWTVPEDPSPGQQYVIMIQIKLNNSVKRYPRSDLAGNVLGTDGYKDFFGGPTEPGYLPINGNSVQVQACVVPGAAQLVKDVITVESKILKEKQVIDIVFLRSRNSDATNWIREQPAMSKQSLLVFDVHEQTFQTNARLSGENWSIQHQRLNGGLSDGVDLIVLDNGALSVSIVPTRGMGIWKGSYRDIPLGWESPVRQVVNPAFVNLNDRNGLGWLHGFNEWLCRCGLAFNGPPGDDVLRDAQGKETGRTPITLHGRIANLPAHRVEIETDTAGDGLLSVIGEVDETSMFGSCLRLTSRIETSPNSNRLTIVDTITNLGGQPAELELLYHTNIGKPFLEAGGQIVAPALEVIPRDQRAVDGVGHWNTYSAPEPGYAEQVYFLKLAARAKNETEVLLRNAKGDRGMGMGFSLEQLPHFTVWKNTAAEADGYVTGMEPATNLPNFKTFEREQGRVISLKPNQNYEARLEIAIYDSLSSVKDAETRIQKLLGGQSPKVHNATLPGWSPRK